MKVHLGSILFSYTNQQSVVEARGKTLLEVLDHLDQQFPGFKFRIVDERDAVRPHIKIFVQDHWSGNLQEKLQGQEEIYILGALSGGF